MELNLNPRSNINELKELIKQFAELQDKINNFELIAYIGDVDNKEIERPVSSQTKDEGN